MKELSEYIVNALSTMGILGPVIGSLLIVVESIFPALPLFVFITLNFLSFGYILGFLISYVCAILGCILSFFMFRNGIQGWFEKRLGNKKGVNKFIKIVDDIKLENLVLLIAVPFTPAFAINIAAGLSKMDFKKFFTGLVIGKFFLVLFWGFIGTSLVETLTNPLALVKVLILVILAYVVSKILNKKIKM